MDNFNKDKEKNIIDLPVLKGREKNSDNKKYWRSLNFLENPFSKEVGKLRRHEFQEGASDNINLEEMPENSRRKFLALASAGAAFGAVACTDYRDKGEIIAYNKKPESYLPGKANYYATTITENAYGWGALIKVREGRPIKINGNPEHPISKGKLSTVVQASILNLYDPSRLQEPLRVTNKKYSKESWDNIDKDIIAALNSAKTTGKEIVFLTNTITSPSLKNLLDEFTSKYPTTKVVSYEYFNENNRISAWKKSYGNTNVPLLKLDNAKIILSIGSDFLGTEGDTTVASMQYASNRDVEKLESFNRLYSVEANMTLTGSNADYRLRVPVEQSLDFVLALINELSKNGVSVDSQVASKVSSFNYSSITKANNLDEKAVKQLVSDLSHNKGKSIVIAGNNMPEEVHIAVNLLNELIGATELYDKDYSRVNYFEQATYSDLANLTNSLKSGKVGVLINFDTNPSFHFPKNLGFDKACSNVPCVVTFSEFDNETAQVSNYVIASNHNLESWGDVKVRNGVYSIVQPVIGAIYNTRQKEHCILNWLTEQKHDVAGYHKYVMAYAQAKLYPQLDLLTDFQTFWNSTLHDGYVSFKEAPQTWGSWNSSALNDINNSLKKDGFTLMLLANHFIGDGRYANNGWLQELPNPITKVTWDNYITMSPATAKALGITHKEYAEFMQASVTANGVTKVLPVYIQVGMAENTLAIELGYGRKVIGEVGREVGFDLNEYVNPNSKNPFILTGVKVAKADGTYVLAGVQEHGAFSEPNDLVQINGKAQERKIIQEVNINEYKADPELLKHHKHEVVSITDPIKYPGVKWAMAIDMNKCTGCAACTISCNVENNIPVVGKDQVRVGREMSWIRIDRYFSGSPENPTVSNQPMLCQHCDNAPCENVCPVVATTHTPDGINAMTYNRCVGTRYCANNCPYKVRRFNYLDFRDKVQDGYYYQESVNLVHNPEVTVRSRGVIEKCTFCIQRTTEARQISKEEKRSLLGSDVVTACQEACPTSAIYFGDMNDKNDIVYKLREHNLGYHVLEEINVKPNVTYIAKIKNVETEVVKGEHSEHH
jgi:molybdopterin-containing oxidoreductase family iron-sulfur binding subunit